MKLINILTTIFLLIQISSFSKGIGGVVGGSDSGKIGPNQNWDAIRKIVRNDHKLKISGDYAYVGQIISIFDVCTDGENFITKKKYPYYKTVRVSRSRDNDGDRDGYTQVVAGYKTLTYPLSAIQHKRQCDNRDKNCKYVPVEFNQYTKKEITVKKYLRTVGSNERDIYKDLFKKEYYVPNCEN